MGWSQCDEAAACSGAHARLTYQHFPLAVGLGHLVSTAHLVQAHAPQDEDDEAGATAVLPWGLILVPVPIAGAKEEERGEVSVCAHSPRAADPGARVHTSAGAAPNSEDKSEICHFLGCSTTSELSAAQRSLSAPVVTLSLSHTCRSQRFGSVQAQQLHRHNVCSRWSVSGTLRAPSSDDSV